MQNQHLCSKRINNLIIDLAYPALREGRGSQLRHSTGLNPPKRRNAPDFPDKKIIVKNHLEAVRKLSLQDKTVMLNLFQHLKKDLILKRVQDDKVHFRTASLNHDKHEKINGYGSRNP